jgi:Protein of unknown function (DUF3352)
MPGRMKVRSVPLLFVVVLAAALAIAGCGGGEDGGSDSTDPATVAPPDSLFFLEVTRPKGKAAANVDALAEKIAGIDDLGEFIVSELESSAVDSGNEVDYGKEVEPWLGKSAAFFPRKYDGDDFSEGGAALQTTDAGEAEEFLEKRAEEADEPTTEESYEGVDFRVDSDDGSALGMIGDFVAYAEDEQTFEAMVDASEGESLADDAKFTAAIAAAPKDSLADVYVDVGSIVKQSGGEIDSDTETGLSLFGIEPEGATAVASAIPSSDQIEIDLSSDVLTEVPPAEDNSFLLGSLPGDSVLALTSSGAGEALSSAFDRLDREGIPDEDIKPGELKSVFKQAGIDLDSIAASITNVGAFLEGSRESNLGGAAVLIASSAQETVTDLGAFLRAAGVDGFTPISGKVSGFSIRDPDLGSKPLVVLADEGIHLVVAYGLRAARNYFDYGQELADNPTFKEATASLGGLPIAGFADGPAALRLALNLVSGDDREDLLEAKPYLSKIDYLAMASESTDDLSKAKLIVGIGK